MRKSPRFVSIQGRTLTLTNLDKVLFPETGFAKKDLLQYYQKIAPFVLPHLKDRPFTLKRFPNGVNQASFYQKQCPSHRPDWVQTGQFEKVGYCLINDLASLIWIANLATIELHTTLGRIENIYEPDFIVFDLDPGQGVGIQECCEVALLLRRELEEVGLEAFPKTSGGKGMHLFVPLNSGASYQSTKIFAHSMALQLEKNYPDRVVSRMPTTLRTGKVFVDWSQNVDFKTTATVYSLRAKSVPGVSTPLTWVEVQNGAKSGRNSASLLEITPSEVLKRCEKHGDRFAPVLQMKQSLAVRKKAG